MARMIHEPSVMSLYLRMRKGGNPIASGSGFVVEAAKGPVLVTNWHNFTGRQPETGEPIDPRFPTLVDPDEVEIHHNRRARLGEWVIRVERLLDTAGRPAWYDHPSHGRTVDAVALPLTHLDDVEIKPYRLDGDPPIAYRPADVVSVIGFPFKIRVGGGCAVWATGFVASEPDIDHTDLPLFLIDCRTRPGQSGSAVIAFRNGGAFATDDGNTQITAGPTWRFLGIYGGRVNAESDLGKVWKATAIKELVDSVR